MGTTILYLQEQIRVVWDLPPALSVPLSKCLQSKFELLGQLQALYLYVYLHDSYHSLRISRANNNLVS